ncbi:DUF4174 domain-containing protein [Flavitalea antarctica]
MSVWNFLIISLVNLINNDMQFRDYREVIIISADQTELISKQQSVFAKDSAGFVERHLKTTICDEGDCNKKYRDYIKAGSKFNVLLIGKDGGVKATWNRLINTNELFALIDAMPMRKSEMKELD